MSRALWLATILWLSACHPSSTKPVGVHPFTGCWKSEDGLAIESWTQDPSGWLFGYALNRDENNQVTFFEQMRFDGEYLTVMGPNDDPTKFKLVSSGPDYIFENPDHDYPQRISYYLSTDRLDAEISLLDGSKKASFEKSACASNSK